MRISDWSSDVCSSDLSAAVIDLVSTGYGLRNNGIKVKVENGTTVGKKVTTQFGDDLYVGDNLIRNAFSLRYTGSESTAVLTTRSEERRVGTASVSTCRSSW